MASMTLQFKISFALNIQVGTGAPAYTAMTAAQKHEAKHELLGPFTTPTMQSLLAQWGGLLIQLDPEACELDDAALRAYVNAELMKAQYVLKGELGLVPALGDSHPNAICMKIPDCSHRCDRMFMLTDGAKRVWQRRSACGVVADIVLVTEWVTPPGMSSSDGGHAH